jgi:hypothetical protein
MAITVQAKCTDMPPTGRSSQAPGLATRPGSSGPSECSFSLPLPPSHQPGEAQLLQSVADGVGGGAHTPADLVDHLAAGLIAWLVPEPGDLRGASPTWATLAHMPNRARCVHGCLCADWHAHSQS